MKKKEKIEKRKEEFKKFINRIKETAPDGYIPWIFPIKQNSKAPDGFEIARRAPKDFNEKEAKCKAGSWKAPHARLTPKEGVEWIRKGGNNGISGRRDDRLILIDADCKEVAEQLPDSLKVMSRSRIGGHGIYFADPEDDKLPCNIPTDKGEVRSSDQYLVAPGSYVPVTEKELKEKVKSGEITEEDKKRILNDPQKGYYTVEEEKPPTLITYKELPEVFRKKVKKDEKKRKEIEKIKKKRKPHKPKKGDKDKSALFKLEIGDVVPGASNFKRERGSHPIHGSPTTGMNFSIGNGVAHCWRHLVSLNALQYLVVESGYMSCGEAGSAHKSSKGKIDSGPSYVIGDDGAIFHAWRQAKENGLIPDDDKLPIAGILHIARKHKLCDKEKIPTRQEYSDHFEEGKEGKTLPTGAYNKVLEVLEDEYKIKTGRKKVGRIGERKVGDYTIWAETPWKKKGCVRAKLKVEKGDDSLTEEDLKFTSGGIRKVAIKSICDFFGIEKEKAKDVFFKPLKELSNEIQEEIKKRKKKRNQRKKEIDEKLEEAQLTMEDLKENIDEYLKIQDKKWVRTRTAEALIQNDHLFAMEDNKRIYRYDPVEGIYRPDGERVVESNAEKIWGDEATNQEVREIIGKVQRIKTEDRDIFKGEGKVVVNNGILDLEELELQEHTPEFYSNKKIDCKYNPEAECLDFKQYLKESMPKEKDRERLQELLGTSLVNKKMHKKGIMIVGPTDAGKSTLIDIIKGVFGKDNTTKVSPHTLSGRWGKPKLMEAMLNASHEIDEKKLKSLNKIKEVMDGNETEAERKGEQVFDFKPTCEHIFASNRTPDAQRSDDAFWNRWLVLEMPYTIPQEGQNPDLVEELLEEKEGILNWIVQGYKDFMENGKKFTHPLHWKDARDKWLDWGSSVQRFIQNCLIRDEKNKMRTKKLHNLYSSFAEELNMEVESQRKLTEAIQEVPYARYGNYRFHGRKQKGFANVSVELPEEIKEKDDSQKKI